MEDASVMLPHGHQGARFVAWLRRQIAAYNPHQNSPLHIEVFGPIQKNRRPLGGNGPPHE
jgi:hypothetical protein